MDGMPLREFIAEKLRHVDAWDHYALLDVARGAEDEELQKAYRRALRVLSFLRGRDGEPHELIESSRRIERALSRAYATLSNPVRRTNYDHEKRPPKPERPVTEAAGITELPPGMGLDYMMSAGVAELGPRRHKVCELLFGRGIEHLQRDEYGAAETLLKRAHELEPDDASYVLKLGWTILHNPERPPVQRRAEARPYLELAVAGAPYDAPTRYAMASYWREAGKNLQWRRELEATLRCDAHHAKARRELDMLRGSESAETGTEGRLRKAPSGSRSRLRGLARLFRRER